MATIQITSENFEQTITGNDIVIIDFWASWCGPCLRFAPVFEEASEKHSDVVFAKVNTEEEQELARMFQVRSIPMVAVFREQIGLFKQAGALPPAALEELLSRIKAVDMDDVRKQIEEEEN